MNFSLISVLLVLFVFATRAEANKSITFEILKNGENMRNCNSSDVTLNVSRNETISVTVVPYELHNSSCFVAGNDSAEILRTGNFERVGQSNIAQVKTDNLKSGKWNCTFLIKIEKKDEVLATQLYLWKNENYTRVTCTVVVNVEDPANHFKFDETTIYYISGGCAIALVVIGQFIVIIYLKRKSAASRKLRHLELQQTPSLDRDNDRYSIGPGQRKNSRKNREEDIYVAVDDLRQVPKSPTPSDIKNRPPMPLPMDLDSDDDHIYKDGKTLSAMFSPEPPPIETLPRNPGKKNDRPKVTPKPINSRTMKSPELDIDDYDYADNNELINTDSLNRAPMKGKKPVPKVPKKPAPVSHESPRLANAKPIVPGGALLMNKLSNKLENEMKMRNKMNIACPKRPVAEKAANAEASWQQSARLKAQENTPPDARALRSPQSFRAPIESCPRPQEYPFQEIARPHDAGPPFKRGPLKAPEMPPGKMGPPKPFGVPPPNRDLPRKPSGAFKKPLPPTPQADELYEPIDEPSDDQNHFSDDEEFEMEELESYSMYVNSVSMLDRHRQH